MPTKDEIESLKYVLNAIPFVEFSPSSAINLNQMQYAYNALPFVRLIVSSTINTNRFFLFFN